MGSAEPAVDPEHLDAIGAAAEHVPADVGEREWRGGEAPRLAARRRRGKPAAFRRSNKRLPARREPGEPPPDPGVAVERRLLTILHGEEEPPGRGRAGGEHLEQRALAPRKAVTGAGKLLEQAVEGRPQERQRGSALREQTLDRRRVGRAKGLPRQPSELELLPGQRHAERPQRFEIGRRQLAEAAEVGPALERTDHDQLDRSRIADERKDLKQLELVVEVVLEPQNDALPSIERPLERAVPPLQRSENRRPRAPSAVAQEPCAQLAETFGGSRRHRPFVEDVVPAEDRTSERS